MLKHGLLHDSLIRSMLPPDVDAPHRGNLLGTNGFQISQSAMGRLAEVMGAEGQRMIHLKSGLLFR